MFFEVLFGIVWRLGSIAVKKKNILLRVIIDVAFQGIYFHIYFDSDMYFDIYSDILFVILSGILSGIYSCILSGTLPDIYSWACCSGPAGNIAILRLHMRSSGEHSDPELAVRVWRGKLRSSACSSCPAGNTLILTLLFGSGGEQCDLALAVEVRQGTLWSWPCCSGLAGNTGMQRLQLRRRRRRRKRRRRRDSWSPDSQELKQYKTQHLIWSKIMFSLQTASKSTTWTGATVQQTNPSSQSKFQSQNYWSPLIKGGREQTKQELPQAWARKPNNKKKEVWQLCRVSFPSTHIIDSKWLTLRIPRAFTMLCHTTKSPCSSLTLLFWFMVEIHGPVDADCVVLTYPILSCWSCWNFKFHICIRTWYGDKRWTDGWAGYSFPSRHCRLQMLQMEYLGLA